MLSRVADSLYWMSRYLERAEHIARVVNVNLNLTLDRAPADAARHWGRLLASLPEPPPAAIRFTADPLERATVDLANRESIAACVERRARERAPGTRGDQLARCGRRSIASSSRCSARIRHSRRMDRRHARVPHRHHQRRAHVPGRDRRHHDPRRRLALHGAGPLSRARQRHGRAARSAVSRMRVDGGPGHRCQRVRGVGRRC